MKKADWALVILIIAIVGLASYFVIGALLPNPVDNIETVQTAAPINPEVNRPNEDIFSEDAINPAVEIASDEQNDPFFNTSVVLTEDNEVDDIDDSEEN